MSKQKRNIMTFRQVGFYALEKADDLTEEMNLINQSGLSSWFSKLCDCPSRVHSGASQWVRVCQSSQSPEGEDHSQHLDAGCLKAGPSRNSWESTQGSPFPGGTVRWVFLPILSVLGPGL